MKRLIGAAAILVAVLLWHAEAVAACVTTTYILDGRVIVCTTCCTGAYCTTTCF